MGHTHGLVNNILYFVIFDKIRKKTIFHVDISIGLAMFSDALI